MNSMKIGTYQMDTTFGLYLPEYTIPAPAVQTNFVKIIGRDGSVDLSNALGLHYDSRTWSLDFKCFDPTVNWHTLSSQVMNAIHGKRLNFEFDDDPDYFWTGRISVSSYVSTRGTGTLKVNITSDPFKYAKLSTIVTKTASTGTEYTGSMVTFNNGLIYDLSAGIEPIQDLHGYSNPWPAGGGKNICPPDGWVQGQIQSNGLTNNASYAVSSPYILLTGGQTYTLSRNYPDYGDGQMAYHTYDLSKTHLSDSGWRPNNYAFTPESDCYIRITTRAKPQNQDPPALTPNNVGTMFIVQLERGSTATSWEPYENICPISGRTGLSVYVGPTQDQQDATTYAVDWTSQAGTVYGGTLDVVTGLLTVDSVKYATTWGNYLGSTTLNACVRRTFTAPNISKYPNYVRTPVSNILQYNADFSGDYPHFYVNRSKSSNVIVTLPAGTSDDTSIEVVYELATPLTYQLTAQEIEALVGTNNVWSDGGDVTVAVVTPETLTNNGRAVVPTLTASADMVLKWGNYSASVQQGTSTIPQLILENGANLIYIIGTGSISFTWQEASL